MAARQNYVLVFVLVLIPTKTPTRPISARPSTGGDDMSQESECNEASFCTIVEKHTRITSPIHTNAAVVLRGFPPRHHFKEARTQKQLRYKKNFKHQRNRTHQRKTIQAASLGLHASIPEDEALRELVGRTPDRLSERASAKLRRQRALFSLMKAQRTIWSVKLTHPSEPRQQRSSSVLAYLTQHIHPRNTSYLSVCL